MPAHSWSRKALSFSLGNARIASPLEEVERIDSPEQAVGEKEFGYDDVLDLPVEGLEHLKYDAIVTIRKVLILFVMIYKEAKTTRLKPDDWKLAVKARQANKSEKENKEKSRSNIRNDLIASLKKNPHADRLKFNMTG